MAQTKTISQAPKIKNGYSDDYLRIRSNAEKNWPAWKVSSYNTNFAVSTHAKKITSK